MPEAAEFEEKEYEFPLGMELMVAPGHIWTPGQALEQYLGWEAAVRASGKYWQLVGRRSKPGVTLQGTLLALPRTHPPLSKNGGGPSFKANLFIQAKRCTRYVRGPLTLTSRLKKGSPRPDPSKTIRAFDVYEKSHMRARHREQQERLERLHYKLQKGGAKADVCYAAPVFDDRLSLWLATKDQELVERSTFPRAILLKAHRKWAYTDPGAKGWKCSDAEWVAEPSLHARVAELVAGEDATDPEPNDWRANTRSIARAVHDALLVHDDDSEHLLDEHAPDSSEQRLKEAFASLAYSEIEDVVAWTAAAAAAHGVMWFVLGPERNGLG